MIVGITVFEWNLSFLNTMGTKIAVPEIGRLEYRDVAGVKNRGTLSTHYYYYYYRISHFSALAGKYSPILGLSNQQD
jgi:hypothetical protein